MAAMATTDGLLDIDEPISKTITQWNDDGRRKITIRHLLTLTSGLSSEGAIARPPDYAEAIKARAEKPPGAEFKYGPTNFQIFGELLKRKLRMADRGSDPVKYLQSRVFDSIGVNPTSWKRGDDGNPYMPQGAQFTARDWAKFGRWVLDGAKGADRKVYSALFESTKANPGYGLSWWLLRPGLIGPAKAAGIDGDAIGTVAANEDIVMAAGAGDQRLYLLAQARPRRRAPGQPDRPRHAAALDQMARRRIPETPAVRLTFRRCSRPPCRRARRRVQGNAARCGGCPQWCVEVINLLCPNPLCAGARVSRPALPTQRQEG